MKVETSVSAILSEISGIGKCQLKFMIEIIKLFLSLRGRYTYLNFARYGNFPEQYYRRHFGACFDFKSLNMSLIKAHCSANRSDLIWIFDPSHISKSGKHTPGVGYFWSGCAGAAKWGLELCGLALGDMFHHTAMHYHAMHTGKPKDEQKLLAYYAGILVKQSAELKKTSATVVVDAFFSKREFVDALVKSGMKVISRLRKDAYLRYAYIGPQKSGRGRKKTIGEKIDVFKPLPAHFKETKRTQDEVLYEGIAHVRALKRWCKVTIMHVIKDGKAKNAVIYFSTDKTTADGALYPKYRLRFQIEFLYRDAKQFTGLEQSQSRQKKALDFHVNLSLSVINIAKVLHWFKIPKDERQAFSMADIKTQYINELLLDKLIAIYGKDPNVEKNNPEIKKLYQIGKIAA